MTEIWDFLRGALMTKALAAVVDAGVPEALAAGPRAVSELSDNPDTLYRLLRALASEGVFRETEPSVFEHTELSRRLLGPGTSEFAHLFGGVFYEATANLTASTSETSFSHRFGADFWSWLAEHPDERATFDAAMAGGREHPAEALAALEWNDDEVVVDVGGGNGALLVELIERRPGLRGIVLDRPETVRDEAALGDRIEFVAGSFFDSVPTGDSFVLSGILHDWPDEDAARILRTIREAADSHARLLIHESVIVSGNEPDHAKWLDLLMLVLAGGRERTEEQWRSLLESTGWEPTKFLESDVIEARPA
ncbi:MAG TPA: methyltransferase [Gaiellaceae bacterium]|nr:methyltransferase [Gaiellaceae bacterium]